MISSLLVAALAGFAVAVVVGGFGPGGEEGDVGHSPSAGYAVPDPWRVVDGWQRYPADRIYEKINGRATLFLSYNVVLLDSVSASRDDRTFDIEVYRMADADGAVGVYLAEASPKASPLGISPLADTSGGLVRAVRGRHYVKVMSIDQTGDDAEAVALTTAVLAVLNDEAGQATGIIDVLPPDGRVAGALAYHKKDAYGLTSLRETFSCTYQRDGLAFDVLVRSVAAGRGRDILTAVRDELGEFGGEVSAFDGEFLAGVLFGRRMLLRRDGDILFGVYGPMTIEQAHAQLRRVAARVRTDNGR